MSDTDEEKKDPTEEEEQEDEKPELHRVYPARWGVLISVSMVNIGINALLYSYSTVANDAARYFGNDTSDVNRLTTVGMVISFFISLVATWLVEKLGLRLTLLLAATLSVVGGLLRMLATLPPWNESLDRDTQFIITMVGQVLDGFANPLGFCLPTRVSVDWFPEHEAPLASGLITMSFTLGLAIATGVTPIAFSDEDLIPWMNIAYFIPAALGFLCAVFLVKSDKPPLPPTHSAVVNHEVHIPYFTKIKRLMTNANFVIIIVCSGGLIGAVNGVMATFSQMTCSSGYSSEFSGICIMLLNCLGVVGGIAASFLYRRTGLVEEQAKISYALGAMIGMPLLYVILQPDLEAVMAILFSLMGILCFGLLPLSAELILENTYPIDPPTGMSFFFAMSQVGSAIVIGLKGIMEQEIDSADAEGQTCSGASDDFSATDDSNYSMVMMGLVALGAVVFIVGLRSEYRRRRVDVNWHRKFDRIVEKEAELASYGSVDESASKRSSRSD